MPDLSWLPTMGKFGLCAVVLGFVCREFIKSGLPKVLAHRKEIQEMRLRMSKGILSEEIAQKLDAINARITESINDRHTNEQHVRDDYSELSMLVYLVVFHVSGLDISVKFDMLIRYFKQGGNGVVKEEAIKLIEMNKTEWLRALNRDKDKQLDNKLYQRVLEEIQRKVNL